MGESMKTQLVSAIHLQEVELETNTQYEPPQEVKSDDNGEWARDQLCCTWE